MRFDLVGTGLGIVALGASLVIISQCYVGDCIASIPQIVLGYFAMLCGIVTFSLGIILKRRAPLQRTERSEENTACGELEPSSLQSKEPGFLPGR